MWTSLWVVDEVLATYIDPVNEHERQIPSIAENRSNDGKLPLLEHNSRVVGQPTKRKSVKNMLAVMLIVLALTLSLSAQSSQCLIVRSAEGHRFRNSMIAGALTGGIGFAAGAAFSGAKYEYADSFNMAITKQKYKGKELEKLQSQGVHVIVVNKKTASTEMDSARNSCKGIATPTLQTAQAPALTPAVTPVSAPVKNNEPVCLSSTIDASGRETCTKYAKQ